MKRRRKRKKISNLTYYVVFCIAVLLIYTVTELLISGITGNINDTLTTCFFAVFGGEILTCALLKIFKLKGENDNEK